MHLESMSGLYCVLHPSNRPSVPVDYIASTDKSEKHAEERVQNTPL